MTNQTLRSFSLLFLTVLLALNLTTRFPSPKFAGAGKIHIPDDLDDVIDDEEDDEWKNWGKKKSKSPQFDVDPSDLDKMEPSQIQAELMKHQTGPIFGFVKLRLGVKRTPDVVSETAIKWMKVMKTGGLDVRFMGMDVTTIMFSTEAGQDMDELKDFILEQPDAYEVKIGNNVYRRPGDPPLEEVLNKLRSQKDNGDGPASDERGKDEL